jgi:predicted metal-dependent HD superfamily phosphohydrolase
MNYPQAHHYAITRLRNELPPETYYHSVDHTLDVCRAATEIANAENVREPEVTILKTAAVFHDIGFVEQYQHHEEAGCRIVREVLPQFGYLPEEIARVEDIIMATRIPQNPEGLLRQIICDADLDYLGRDDFFEISDRLRQEWEANGVKYSADEWIESQIAFLEQHQYFTATSQRKRAPTKQRHLDALKALQ